MAKTLMDPTSPNVKEIAIERDMWKQRTKTAIMLLVEAEERLDGTLPAYDGMTSKEKNDAVAQWINEIYSEGWMAEVKAMPNLPHRRLAEIEDVYDSR